MKKGLVLLFSSLLFFSGTSASAAEVPAIQSTAETGAEVWSNQASGGFTLQDTITYQGFLPNAEYAIRAEIRPVVDDQILMTHSPIMSQTNTFTTDETGAGTAIVDIPITGGRLPIGDYAVVFIFSYDNIEAQELNSVDINGTITPTTGTQIIYFSDAGQRFFVKEADFIQQLKEFLNTLMPVWSGIRSAQTGIQIYNLFSNTTAAQALSTATGSTVPGIIGSTMRVVGSSFVSSAVTGSSFVSSIVLAEVGAAQEKNNT